jgi:acetyl esterase/lipase
MYDVEITRDVCYRSPKSDGFHPIKHTLDIYTPIPKKSKNDSKSKLEEESETFQVKQTFPVINYVHGGAWCIGQKDQDNTENIGCALASEGYVVVIHNYRLAALYSENLFKIVFFIIVMLSLFMLTRRGMDRYLWFCLFVSILLTLLLTDLTSKQENYPYPCQFYDSLDAMEWTQNHIAEFRGNIHQRILMGHSAGAHIALMLTVHPDAIERMEHFSCKKLVLISGVYNPKRLSNSTMGFYMLRSIFGKNPKQWTQSFPLYFLKTFPNWKFPSLLILSSEFEWGLKVHTCDLIKSLKKKQIQYLQKGYLGLNHFSIVTSWDKKNSFVKNDILSFIRSGSLC